MYTLNQETMEVTIRHEIIGSETVPYLTFYARQFVIQHLHWTGTYYGHVLNQDEWREAYLMCDGFGDIWFSYAEDKLEWNWSHVRDSSDETFLKVAQWIAGKHWHLNTIEALAQKSYEDCLRCGIDPILGVPGM